MYITFNIYTQEKKKTHLLLPFFFSGTCFVLYFFVIFFTPLPLLLPPKKTFSAHETYNPATTLASPRIQGQI